MRASARIPAGDFGHSHLGENENQTQPLFLSSSPFFLWDRLLVRAVLPLAGLLALSTGLAQLTGLDPALQAHTSLIYCKPYFS